jgi:hypothetical protein
MSNFTDKKKDAFRIASRFIKELGLYDIWLKYLYDPNTSKSWLDKPDSKFFDSDILGCTTFTDYVYEHKPTFKVGGYLIYELLNSYLMALRDPKGICYPVKIDNEKKKITLFDY